MPRLNCELLETRENPAGPVLVDPIGVPVTEAPPAVVTTTPTPTETAPTISAIDRIIQETLAALAARF
jgi:hypothetical protein